MNIFEPYACLVPSDASNVGTPGTGVMDSYEAP